MLVKKMDFGVAVSNMHKNLALNLNLLTKIVVEAENLGFNSFFTMDHYMLPWGNETVETWTFLTYVAAQTSKIRLGTCVTPIPLRPPQILAKQISTLDLLSNGRIIFGVGAGLYQPEFEGYSQWDNPAVRVEKTEEGLRLMIKLWTEAKVNFEGKYYMVKDAVLEPKPIQKPYPPIWFGSTGKRMLNLTAKMGDGWIPLGPRWARTYITPEEYREKVEKINFKLKSLGRKIKFTHAILVGVAENLKTQIEEIEAYKKAGTEYFVLGLPKLEKSLEQAKIFAKEVIPSFK